MPEHMTDEELAEMTARAYELAMEIIPAMEGRNQADLALALLMIAARITKHGGVVCRECFLDAAAYMWDQAIIRGEVLH